MRIISWNVNGLRAVQKKEGWKWLIDQSADIFCLQETKCTPDQLDPATLYPDSYKSYFAWPTEKKGYSGVAIYSKEEPEEVKYGLGVDEFDQEGRLITAFYKDFALANVYFPNGGQGPHRLEFKLKYYDLFLDYIDSLTAEGVNVIFCGDVNTAHTEIDLARPAQNVGNTGFLPIEREWIDKVMEHGYVDAFRALHPQAKDVYTYWDMKTLARERNVGWRIDYFFAHRNILPKIKRAEVHENIFGSDHCPISITVSQ